MSRLCLYFRPVPERDRWVPGDRFIRPQIRWLIRGKPRPSGIDKVFANLCLGLDRLGVPYAVNLPFGRLASGDRVGVLGRGRHVLDGYDRVNPIVAGIGLMTHPSEWPTLCDEYPIAAYLQHSPWANAVYVPYYGDRCRIWPVGIDTEIWQPAGRVNSEFDFLIYDKIRWGYDKWDLLPKVTSELEKRNLKYMSLRYGHYEEADYRSALSKCRYMIFLCEHESQGLAYLECLSFGVPILAWDQGRCLDPNRFAWGTPDIPATSVPYFDDRCGLRFASAEEFPEQLERFLDLGTAGRFSPRDYVLENLTLEMCSGKFLEFFDGIS